jgi:hypothetical protein
MNDFEHHLKKYPIGDSKKNLEIGQTIYYYICWRLCTQYLGDVEF